MSHHATGLPPHVVSYTPASLPQAGLATISITGARLSATCELKIPAALGTVVSGPVLSGFSTTTATATWTINVLSPPASPATRVCVLSNGGQANTGVAISIDHLLWTPDQLVTSADCAWFRAADALDGSSNPATDGGSVVNWPASATTITSTVDKIRQRSGYNPAVFRSSVSSMGGYPAVLNNFEDVAGTIGNTNVRLQQSGPNGWDLDPYTQPFTVAVNMKRTPYGDANASSALWMVVGNSSSTPIDAWYFSAGGDIRARLVTHGSTYAVPLTGQTVAGRNTYVFTGDGAGASLTATAWHNGNTATVSQSGASSWTWANANYWSTLNVYGWNTDILFLDYAMTAAQSSLLDSWFAARYGA